MTRLLLVCGSTRPNSLNAGLLDAVARALPGSLVPDRLHGEEVALPLWSAEAEDDPAVLAHARRLHARFAAAAGLIIASPEFNGSISPFAKNLIDWVSRLPRLEPGAVNPFLDKPALLIAATPGWSGGAFGLLAVRTVLAYVGAVPFGETICLPFADQARLPDGGLDPDVAGPHWRGCVERFAAMVQRVPGAGR